MENGIQNKQPVELIVDFKDEMSEIIAAVLTIGRITPEKYTRNLTEHDIKELNKLIMEVLLRVHRKGLKDMERAMKGETKQ